MARRGHGEGTIYRDQDGTWRAALSLTPEERSGLKYFRGKTRQEVQQKLAAARSAQEDGVSQTVGRQTVAQFLASWLQTIKPTVDLKTWKGHEQFVRLHIVPIIGQIRLASLTAQQVQALYADRLAAGLSTSSVHHLHATLHKALKNAERLRIVARNVSTMVDAPRMAETEIHPLSREEGSPVLRRGEP